VHAARTLSAEAWPGSPGEEWLLKPWTNSRVTIGPSSESFFHPPRSRHLIRGALLPATVVPAQKMTSHFADMVRTGGRMASNRYSLKIKEFGHTNKLHFGHGSKSGY
jgi:hypothetical protein